MTKPADVPVILTEDDIPEPAIVDHWWQPLEPAPGPDTTVLYLIRHGATKSNLCRPYVMQGQTIDHDLVELGRRQAQAMAQTLKNRPITTIYASPLKRAQTTAQALADALNLPIQTVPELIEILIGEWEGLSWDQIAAKDPDRHKLFMQNPTENRYPGGENFEDVRLRCQPVFDDIIQRHRGQSIAVISHNCVNRVMVCHWMRIPVQLARKIPQFNASYTRVEFTGDQSRVVTLNQIDHLAGLLPID